MLVTFGSDVGRWSGSGGSVRYVSQVIPSSHVGARVSVERDRLGERSVRSHLLSPRRCIRPPALRARPRSRLHDYYIRRLGELGRLTSLTVDHF